MTSSTASNSIIASLARNAPSHRAIITPRSIFRSRSSTTSGQSRRVRPVHRRRMSTSSVAPISMPVVDMNNNNSALPMVAPAPATNAITLDRVAILKAFAASQMASGEVTNQNNSNTTSANRMSRFEKPTSYREARRRANRSASMSDPAIEQEFVRLRDTVPSIAGSNVSDLTIINEAISLICDLESQLIRKLKCQNLSALHPSSN